MKSLRQIFFLAFIALSGFALAVDKGEFSTAPKTNNGNKWRIGYYEGGEYLNYQQVLIATVRGLMQLGWIETTEIPVQQGEQTKDLWNWMAKNLKSKYITFATDAHYSANWDDKTREKIAKEVIDRLNKKKDIDLIIAMGTWAGKDLANDKHHVPTLVFSTSDPVSAGIIKSTNDSGLMHVYAQVDPEKYARQIKLFHEIIGFKKLGVAFEDSESGRSYAAIEEIKKVARNLNFEIVTCFTKSDIPDIKIATETVKNCFNELVTKVDAIYVTEQGGVNNSSIQELVQIAINNRMPTFAQYGPEMVKYGFLLSTSTAGYKYLGAFYAEVIAKVLNGALPNQLDQVFEEPPKIALNIETAELVNFNPPLLILGAADEIYRKITPPEKR
jgi:ABC-type uncharacterized transport system substrate-binding protein